MRVENPLPPSLQELPAYLDVEPLVDAQVELEGFGPRSPYVEACYLPVLGPTATWLYRRLGTVVLVEQGRVSVDMVDLSVSLGIGEGLSRHSKLGKALGRLVSFHAAGWNEEVLQVRRALPPLRENVASGLSLSAYRAHTAMLEMKRSKGAKS